MKISKNVQRFTRRWALVLFNVIFHHALCYSVLGWLNKRYDFLVSIFVAYPASAEYASYYFARPIVQKARWSPVLCGLLRQNGKWILGFGISSLEVDFHKDTTGKKLSRLVHRAEQLRKLTGTRQITYSGILPGILNRRDLVTSFVEAEVTVSVILRAIELVSKAEKLDSGVPIIVLGGRGYIGSHLLQRLETGRGYSVDVASPEDIWPQHLTGKPTILINVANRRALRKYASKLWAGLTLLNEVYPEPPRQEIAAFTQLGNAAYHIVGIKASSYPGFPKVYAGGIPCCAGWPSENIEAIIRRLNDENAMR